MLLIKLLCGFIDGTLSEAFADLTVLNAALDPSPVACLFHSLLQPIRVVSEPVLLVAPVGHHLAGALVGDDEGEDCEAEEEENEEEHDAEVEPEQPRDPAAGAHEACEGDEHEEGAYAYDRPLEKFLAVGVGFGGQPYSAAQDGDGKQKGEEVEDADKAVGESNHLSLKKERRK